MNGELSPKLQSFNKHYDDLFDALIPFALEFFDQCSKKGLFACDKFLPQHSRGPLHETNLILSNVNRQFDLLKQQGETFEISHTLTIFNAIVQTCVNEMEIEFRESFIFFRELI